MTTSPKSGYARKPAETAPGARVTHSLMHAPPARPAPRGIAAAIGAAVLLWAAGIMISAYDLLHAPGREAIVNPVMVQVGLFVGAIGYVCLVRAAGLDTRAQAAGAHVMLLSLAMVFTWLIFGYEFVALSALPFGNRLPRIACVAIDLYIVISFGAAMVRNAVRPAIEKRHRFAVAAAAVASAVTLDVTGTVNAAYLALGMTPPGPGVVSGALVGSRLPASFPELPLAAYAGGWSVPDDEIARFHGWSNAPIARVEVRVANDKASARIWRKCPPRPPCDMGIFEAGIEARHRGRAQALHFTGRWEGMDWLVSLRPQRGGVELEERHIRGRDWNTHQQTFAQLRHD